MKPLFSFKSRNPFLRSALLTATTLAFSLSAQAGTYYWDTDGSGTPGFGTASGTWGTDAFWGTDPAGSGATANTSITAADDVNFGTATDGLALGTVTGPATAESFLNMTFGAASGAIALSGGTLNLDTTTGSTVTVNNASDSISTVLQGTGGKLIKAGAGTLTLSGNNTYTGTTTASAGTLKISGPLRSTSALVVSGTLDVAVTNLFTSGHRVALNAPITINAGGTVINSNNSLNRIGDINLNGGTLTATFNEGNYGSYFIGQANGVDPTVAVGGSVASTINATNNGNFKMWSNVNFNVGNATGDANADLTVSAVLGNQTADQSGAAASLTKSGSGTMVLSAANNYTGATTINDGTLKLQNTYASSGFSVASGAVLELNGGWNGATTTFSGTGTLRKTGAGNSLWVSGAATFALGSGSLIDVQEGTFTGGSSANEVWSANLSDLNVAGGAKFNTVEANVRVNKITGTGTIGTGYSGAGYANLTIGVDNGSSTFDGVIQNSDNNPSYVGKVLKAGSGTIILAGNNTYTGTTTISGGTLEFSGNNNIGAVTVSAGSLNFTGGTTAINGNLNQTVNDGAALTISNSVVTMNQLYSNGTGDAGLAFTIGAGADVTASGGTYSRTFRGSGGMFLNGGTLRTSYLAANSASGPWWINDRGYIHFNGTQIVATADEANFIQLAAGANYANENFAKLNATTTFDTAGYNIGIGVILNGTGGLTKSGGGTLTLSGANSYTGATTVNGGVLTVDGSTAAGSAVAVGGASATGTPTLSGIGTVNGPVTINDASGGGVAGTLNPGAVGTIGTLNTGAATINGALAIDIDASSSDQLVVTGNLDLTDSTLALNELAVPAATPYTIATYSGTLTGTFASPPSGYTVNYGSGTNDIITLTKSGVTPDYNTWGAPYGLTIGSEDGDLDGDGVKNQAEYAFGLIPNSGSSVNPILVPLSKSAGTFTYQRRKPSLTGLTSYKILTSSDLATWTPDATAGQVATAIPSTDNESVVVTLTTPPTAAKFFIRVSAN